MKKSVCLLFKGTRLKFGLQAKLAVSLQRLFGAIEGVKKRLGIIDYSLQQTPLEQIFLMMAKKQHS